MLAGSWRLRGHCAGCCDCWEWHSGFVAGWPKPASGDCAGYPPDRQPEGTSPLRRRGNVLAAIQQPSYLPAKAGKRVFTAPAGAPRAAEVVQAENRIAIPKGITCVAAIFTRRLGREGVHHIRQLLVASSNSMCDEMQIVVVACRNIFKVFVSQGTPTDDESGDDRS